ncbi:MAG: ATP-dependent Clp protease proteolytic subunit, partial [Akkermansia sp.]
HLPRGGVFGLASEIKAYAEQLAEVELGVFQVYATRCKKTVDEIRSELKEGEQWMSAQEAIDAGWCDAIFGELTHATDEDPPADDPKEEGEGDEKQSQQEMNVNHQSHSKKSSIVGRIRQAMRVSQVEKGDCNSELMRLKAELSGAQAMNAKKDVLLRRMAGDVTRRVELGVVNRVASMGVNIDDMPSPSDCSNLSGVSKMTIDGFLSMTVAETAAWMKSHPAEYNRLMRES